MNSEHAALRQTKYPMEPRMDRFKRKQSSVFKRFFLKLDFKNKTFLKICRCTVFKSPRFAFENNPDKEAKKLGKF